MNIISLRQVEDLNLPGGRKNVYYLFTYSLFPHTENWFVGGTVQEAWDLNHPLTYLEGEMDTTNLSLLKLSCDYVLVDAIKKAEDSNGVIVRMHEFSGKRGKVSLESDLSIKYWQEVDLMERPIGELNQTDSISFSITPYEIKTFYVELEN